MANIKRHKAAEYTKLMLVGDSGSGKTTALSTLANAGYNLRILDFDDGLSILPEFLNKDAVKNAAFSILGGHCIRFLFPPGVTNQNFRQTNRPFT